MSISSKGFLSLNSRNRTEETRPIDARYEGFKVRFDGVNGLGVCKVQFSESSPFNITPYNNRIFWQDASFSYESTVPAGSYTATTFATALQAQMSAAAPGTLVSEVAGVFTISSVLPISFLVPRNNDGTLFYKGKVINEMLFIPSNGQLLLAHVGSQAAELFYSSYCDITSSDIHTGKKIYDSDSNNITSNILHRVYFTDPTTPQGKKKLDEIENIKWINSDLTNDLSLVIRLYDEYGNIYYDPNETIKYSILIMLT